MTKRLNGTENKSDRERKVNNCFSSVQSVKSLSHVWMFATPWTTAQQASLSISNSQSLLKLISIESVMPCNHFILCCRLLLLPEKSALHIRWPRYWSFSFSISPSNEYSGLISFRMDWLDLLVVHKPQESSPAPRSESINFLALLLLYRPSLICIHGYWKNIAFTILTLVCKAMS